MAQKMGNFEIELVFITVSGYSFMRVRIKLTWGWVLGCAGMAWMGTGMAAADIAPANAHPSPVDSNKLASVAAAAIMTPADANPYSVISNRNVFHLSPPPPPVEEAQAPPDLPKVMLTGFLGKGSFVKVLLAIPPKENKDPMVYLTLAPGEKGGEAGRDVELVSIRLDKEEVDIINSGTPQTLSVKSNSFVSTAAPAGPHPGAAPAMPRMPGIHRAGGFPPGMKPQSSTAPAPSSSGGGSAIVIGGDDQGGSAIVAGGGGGGFGESSSGAIVSGGGSFAMGGGAGAQIPGIFNQPGQIQTPTSTATPIPLVNQVAHMLLQEAAGGPPSPVHIEEPPSP